MKLTFTAAEINKLIVRDLKERNLVQENQICTITYSRSKTEQMLVSVDISAPVPVLDVDTSDQ